MIFWETFKQCIKLPSKKALFKLNRTGMDIVVIYMFMLLFITSIPALTERLTNLEGVQEQTHIVFLLIYFFIFYYIPLVLIAFAALTILTCICLVITKIMNRKLRFAILWKMSAYVTTIPFLLYTILAFFIPLSSIYLTLSLLYTLVLLIKMISIYPKRRTAK